MKATELMIGDWVQYNCDDCKGKPTKIEAFDFNALQFFDPIQITSEILEKNGITLLEVGDNGPSTPKKYLNRFEKWFIHTTWKDTFLWFDRYTKEYHLHNMSGAEFKYVHELQHALRLCGIKEEIVL